MESLRRWVLVFALGLFGSGCATTEFYERAKLKDRSMRFDDDIGYVFIRHKTEAAREGSLGGYGAAAAGGCACQ